MEFRIADTFTDSLARLTGDEQKAVKTTAFDLQIDPVSPGMSFHKLDKARDKNFWSVRVSSDIRLIVHRSKDSLLLCYVDHHDKAYDWAERRKLETHPATGAAQLVEIRETVRKIEVPVFVESNRPADEEQPPRPLLAGRSDEELLGYGIPQEWLSDVKAADEDALLALAGHLPAEAAEALLELATGGTPSPRQVPVGSHNPFEHPDALRRFRVVANVEELERALSFPWDKWTVFLHPDQRQWVEREFSGPARVSGSAGTGKTVVALHRAAFLARANPDARVLLTTYSDPLAAALHTNLRRLLADQPRLAERIDVDSLDSIGTRLYKKLVGPFDLVQPSEVLALLRQSATDATGSRLSARFLLAEWEDVVDAWQLSSWDEYRNVARLGRKTRLSEAQRKSAWTTFDHVLSALRASGKLTRSAMFTRLAAAISGKVPFDHVIVDESQDLSVSHLRFLAALAGVRRNGLFFAGDLGQRIFQPPFSWKSLGVDVRGRARTLRVNYRTSHQIRSQADRLLGPALTDIDGNTEERKHTVSVFNGVAPMVRAYASGDEEVERVAEWMIDRQKEGFAPHELAVFVRSDAQLDRARRAAEAAKLPYVVLDERVKTVSQHVAIASMHLAKGLEFRAVAVMACDDEVIPLQARIEAVGDEADLAEVYDTERHLLYVACTRARDYLHVSAVKPASEFLDDLMT